MGRIPRMILLALIAVGVIAAVVGAIWLLGARTPTKPDGLDAMGPLERGMTVLANSRRGTLVVGALVAAAVGALGLAVFVWRDRPWAHALAALAAVLAIPMIWKLHGDLAALEPLGYRGRSVYVAAMTRVARGGTLYFAALALAAIGALVVVILARRRATQAIVEKVTSVT